MTTERVDVDDVVTTISDRFPYPTSVLLFNRPEYARLTLESLPGQTLPVVSERVTLSIDGYAGSKDETAPDLCPTPFR